MESKKRKAQEDISSFFKPLNSKRLKQEESKEEVKEKPATPEKHLPQLLDFDMASLKSVADYRALFGEIADKLMNEYVLAVGNKKQFYRIAEIEFYFKGVDGVHPDTFTHCDDFQRANGQWYFHRSGNSYRGGTYKGLDLAFGKGEKGHGGILIRSLLSVHPPPVN